MLDCTQDLTRLILYNVINSNYKSQVKIILFIYSSVLIQLNSITVWMLQSWDKYETNSICQQWKKNTLQ